MSRLFKLSLVLSVAAAAGLVVLAQQGARDADPKKDAPKSEAPPNEAPKPEAKPEAPAAPVKAKPITDNVKKGLAYLINQQHADGGWGQGGGWRQADQGGGRVEGANVADPSDLGSTCMALLALIRAGHTPKEGEYAKNVARGVDFLLTKIEKADKDSLYITDVRNTQIQSKIGPYVDTFMGQLVMAELKGKMPDEKAEQRLVAGFDKTIAKIAKHQGKDGNFAKNEAWASALSMALCSKGFNRAAQNGFMVPQTVLAADQRQNTAGLNLATGRFEAEVKGTSRGGGTAAASDANIPLYSTAGKSAGLQEAVNTLKKDEKRNLETVASPTAPAEEKVKAKSELERLGEAEKAQTAAVDGLIRRLDDKAFIQGFGNNGGEEFLSYMNISETLVVKGGKNWEAWDKGIGEVLNMTQDKDGGWSGKHCITGRTLCTATALLTLLADRAPIPVVKKDEPKEEKKDEKK